MIRPATPQDARFVAPLMFEAMEEMVYFLIGKEDKAQGIRFLERLFQMHHNQYSHRYCFVYEQNSQILGSVVVYNGALFEELLKELFSEIAHYGTAAFSERETAAGEFYIDTLSVHSLAQGQGIGTKLLHFVCEKFTTEPVGLLVASYNHKAEKLYRKEGFSFVGEKTFGTTTYKHLQYKHQK